MQGSGGLRIIAEIQIQDEELYQLKLKVILVVCVYGCVVVAALMCVLEGKRAKPHSNHQIAEKGDTFRTLGKRQVRTKDLCISGGALDHCATRPM